MYRHSPHRHQKSKGFRLKHVLQICVLVAVCFWLIYQVKHSHDKKKQFDENDGKTSRDMEMDNAVLKLGRKDLNPQEKGPNKDLESHDEEAEEEIVEEDKNEEENGEKDKNEEEIGEDKHGEEIELEDKHEEESEEEDKHEEETGDEDKNEEETGEDKHEETGEDDKNEEETGEDKHEEETREEDEHEEETGEEDKLEEETGVEDKHEKEEQEEDVETEEKGEEVGGDDGVNEQEQKKTNSSNNQEEELIEENKEKEDTDEKETEDKYDDDKDSQQKNDSSIEDHDHDERSKNTREAREEHYKGDDASSAVSHDGQITSSENIIGHMENQASTEEHKNKTEEGNAGQNTTDVNEREVEAAGNGNLTSNVEKSSNGQLETKNNTDPQDLSVKNETEIIMPDLSHSLIVTDGNVTASEGTNVETLVIEQPDNSTVALENAKLDSNSSDATPTKNMEENSVVSRDSSTTSEFVSSETLVQSNVSAKNKDGSESTTTVESTDEVGNENPENAEGTEGTYENLESSNTEDTDEVQHDSIDSSDSSIPVDDKENHIDLDTLPDIRTEGTNSEEVAEE
ncbi:uncharacterized protein LOC141668643 [Apium graveolens]|uniref:uncharacterized protein LOC141668643 n=1 Tax=Apium graveolens TaxID=4045 RepID=UPI003D7BD01E